MKFVRSPARGVAFLIAAIWASVVLLTVAGLWLTLFILFLPWLLLSELLGRRRKESQESISLDAVSRTNEASAANIELVFDRRSDVSKLFGCNTRSVNYRWKLFSNRLNEIKRHASQPRALDFGAGSLRDSYELIKEGFRVTSMDLDPQVMETYLRSYSWSASAPEPFTNSIETLVEQVGPDYFDLAISFDVIEHLEHPEHYLQNLKPILRPEGYLFAIVPNRRSIFERYFKHSIRKQKQKGLTWTRGVPHLQFRSPEEWRQFFEANGFEIVEHDMAIGPLVNDLWYGLLGLPVRVFVAPVLHRIAYKLRFEFNPAAFEEGFFPSWLMTAVDLLDEFLKPLTRGRFGWNLIVARGMARTNSPG